MTQGLIRYQQAKHFHFITFSCWRRLPYFNDPAACDLFEHSLEKMRVRYDFVIAAYVVMPEHVHLLVSEPRLAKLSKAVQALKLAVAVKRPERPFWMARYYDFNVFTTDKRVEKLRYIHRNPVTRGLSDSPQQWRWTSFRHYLTGEQGTVEITAVS